MNTLVSGVLSVALGSLGPDPAGADVPADETGKDPTRSVEADEAETAEDAKKAAPTSAPTSAREERESEGETRSPAPTEASEKASEALSAESSASTSAFGGAPESKDTVSPDSGSAEPSASASASGGEPESKGTLSPETEAAIWALASYGAKMKHKALTERPMFSGNGLLIGSAVSLGLAWASGITVSVLRGKDWDVCGEPYCVETQYDTWRILGGYTLAFSGAGGLALGIAGSVMRGRYDAWRMVVKNARAINTPLYYLGGAGLLAAGGGLGMASLVLFVGFESTRSQYVAAPLLFTGAATCSTLGTGLIAYAASRAVRAAHIERVMAIPLVDRDSGAAGLSLTGRF